MKVFQFYKHGFFCGLIGLVCLLVPGSARAEACKPRIQATFKRQVVELELALISGLLSEFELEGKRADLHKALLAKCRSESSKLTAFRAKASFISF